MTPYESLHQPENNATQVTHPRLAESRRTFLRRAAGVFALTATGAIAYRQSHVTHSSNHGEDCNDVIDFSSIEDGTNLINMGTIRLTDTIEKVSYDVSLTRNSDGPIVFSIGGSEVKAYICTQLHPLSGNIADRHISEIVRKKIEETAVDADLNAIRNGVTIKAYPLEVDMDERQLINLILRVQNAQPYERIQTCIHCSVRLSDNANQLDRIVYGLACGAQNPNLEFEAVQPSVRHIAAAPLPTHTSDLTRVNK